MPLNPTATSPIDAQTHGTDEQLLDDFAHAPSRPEERRLVNRLHRNCTESRHDGDAAYAPHMAITGVHALIYSPEADALRAVLRDVLRWPNVDAHDGWLIFALPPAELGVHPADSTHHELSLMCDDIDATIAELQAKGIEFDGPPENRGFGIGANMILPGDVRVLLYQPRHTTAI